MEIKSKAEFPCWKTPYLTRIIPLSHFSPSHPASRVHEKSFKPSWHVPCLQGFVAQLWTSAAVGAAVTVVVSGWEGVRGLLLVVSSSFEVVFRGDWGGVGSFGELMLLAVGTPDCVVVLRDDWESVGRFGEIMLLVVVSSSCGVVLWNEWGVAVPKAVFGIHWKCSGFGCQVLSEARQSVLKTLCLDSTFISPTQ